MNTIIVSDNQFIPSSFTKHKYSPARFLPKERINHLNKSLKGASSYEEKIRLLFTYDNQIDLATIVYLNLTDEVANPTQRRKVAIDLTPKESAAYNIYNTVVRELVPLANKTEKWYKTFSDHKQ